MTGGALARHSGQSAGSSYSDIDRISVKQPPHRYSYRHQPLQEPKYTQEYGAAARLHRCLSRHSARRSRGIILSVFKDYSPTADFRRIQQVRVPGGRSSIARLAHRAAAPSFEQDQAN
jgi:hypothetical protein